MLKKTLLLCVLAAPLTILSQAITKVYTYPGTGTLIDQGNVRVNEKAYQTTAECLADARAHLAKKRETDQTTKVLYAACTGKTIVVNELVSVPPPPTPTTPGLGKLPTNPRLNTGYSTERVGGTSEVAGPSNDGTGDFRTRCEPSHYAFEDPIVFPGQPGRSHLHIFFGNTGVNVNSTTTSLLSSGNSTCRGGTVNRSSYWVPAIIDMATSLPINPVESDFYYKSGYHGIEPRAIKPMPQGLRMIAGDPLNRSADGADYGQIYNWVCHNTGLNRGPTIPTSCPVGDMLELSVFFPQCWSGELDSPDHKSHMAYARGSCPASHPTPLPEVSFHILYPIPANGVLTNWRLSSDTYEGKAGYSAHADWFNGWKKDVSDSWSINCVAAGRDCHSHLYGDGRAQY